MIVDGLDVDDIDEHVAYLTRLTKSSDFATRERAQDMLDRLATVDLEKVGPKGYVHGWIHVGVPSAGERVFHPEHGHGTISRSGKRTVGVRFDDGKEHSFEHGRGSGESFAQRVDRRRRAPGAAEVHGHVDSAHAAIKAGKHAEAADHLAAAVAKSHPDDKALQRKIDHLRKAAAVAAATPKAKKPKVPAGDAERQELAKQFVKRMAAGEKFSVDPAMVPHLLKEMDGGDAVNMAMMQLKGRGNGNLFQKHMRDIPRDQMPALPDNVHDLQPFMDALVERNVKFELVHMNPKVIGATQSQLSGPKVAKLAGFMTKGGWKPGGALIVSQENALLDGHHRWAGAAMASIQHELGVPGAQPVNVMALKVDLPIDELLKLGEEFSGPKKALGEAP